MDVMEREGEAAIGDITGSGVARIAAEAAAGPGTGTEDASDCVTRRHLRRISFSWLRNASFSCGVRVSGGLAASSVSSAVVRRRRMGRLSRCRCRLR